MIISSGNSLSSSHHFAENRPASTMRNLLLIALLQLSTIVSSFSVGGMSTRQLKQRTALASSVDDEKVIQCFIVNAFEVDEEGAFPEVVCTPEPDEYAWFNGLSREAMQPADGVYGQDFLECVEGHSPRGVPEWECKKKITDEVAWQ